MATSYLTNPPSLSVSHRRIPPPCWSQEETAALIDIYCKKWYSLQRGNLRANHWQEVSDDVADRCHVSFGIPRKTPIQCRHKIEKLKKRYRGEVSRAAVRKGPSYMPSWVHFKQMDLMEKGPLYSDPTFDPMGHDPDQDDNDEEEDINRSSINKIGYRVMIPGRVSDYLLLEPSFGSGKGLRNENDKSGFGRGGGGKNSDDQVAELVAAINRLGDVYVRTERMRMDTVNEVESMQMEMEMKRIQMILEMQERLVDSFSNETLEKKKNKKIKRIPILES